MVSTAGLTYALLLVFGVKFTPAVILALFLSSVFIYRMPQPPFLLFLWSFIVSLIYVATAWFLRHRINLDWQLRKLRDVTWLVFTAVFVSAFLPSFLFRVPPSVALYRAAKSRLQFSTGGSVNRSAC